MRYLTNASSGAMGIELAQEAARSGGEVTLVLGPVVGDVVPEYRSIGVSEKKHLVTSPLPRHPVSPIRCIYVVSAWDMYNAVKKHLPGTDIFIGAAAVVDYRPAQPLARKIKHHRPSMALRLYGNPDIIAMVGHLKEYRPSLVLGFALETDHLLENAREKMIRKRMDWIVANRESNMGQSHGEAVLLSRWGDKVTVSRRTKMELARTIWKTLLKN